MTACLIQHTPAASEISFGPLVMNVYTPPNQHNSTLLSLHAGRGGANRTMNMKSMHRGGAIWMQSPSCKLTWDRTHFEGNAARTEGGAVAISDLTARSLNLTGCTFSANTVRGMAGGCWGASKCVSCAGREPAVCV